MEFDCSLQEHLAAEWRKSGVADGDVLLLHSSVRRTLRQLLKKRVKVTPRDILESFLTAIGHSGTLLIPLFNFDFVRGVPFVLNTTRSQMGMLSETGRVHPKSVRTGHPIYSFAAIGRRSDEFQDINNFSGYGSDSPFAMLREMNGRIAVLNLPDQNSMTFYHHVEEMHGVSYRYHKTFSGEYTDAAGKTDERIYGLFVRDIEQGVLTWVNPTGELMWEEGLYRGSRPSEGNGLRTVAAPAMYEFVSEIITSGRAKGLLYRIEGERYD